MPDEWSTHVGHRFRRKPQKLYGSRPKVGMLHFTGPSYYFGANIMVQGGTSKQCRLGRGCNHTADKPDSDMCEFQRTQELAKYYGKITWNWIIYQGGASRIRSRSDGHLLNYIKRVCHAEGQNAPFHNDGSKF